MLNAVEAGSKELLKYGITEVQDRSVNKESISIFRELIDSGKFPIRIYCVLTGNDESFDQYINKGIEVNYKDKLSVRAVTIDYDGSVELQSAAMKDEYISEPKRKKPYTDDTIVENIMRKALDKNFQFTIKTVGDKAVNSALNIIEKVNREKNINDARLKLESIEFIQPGDINRIKELKIIPSLRPEACMYDIDVIPLKIPNSNTKNFALWNTLLQNAGMITTGTGFPFSHSINPFIQMYYLSQRQFVDTVRKNIPSENQKILLMDALKSYTIWAAYSGFEDSFKGSLEKGKFADMVVVSEDIFGNDAKILLRTKVLKTIINGKTLYEYKD
jgi:predicted amidohydrolase YtcJ